MLTALANSKRYCLKKRQKTDSDALLCYVWVMRNGDILSREIFVYNQRMRKDMFEILDKTTGNIVTIRLEGKLAHDDYAQFVPKLEKLIAEHGKIRCYCEMGDFAGMTPHALWDELKFDTRHFKDVERCAIVGDPSWHQWMTKVGQTIFRSTKMKYFEQSQSEEAWQWVCDDTTK